MLNELDQESKRIGLKINQNKTKVMINTEEEVTVKIGEINIRQVEEYIYTWGNRSKWEKRIKKLK